MLPDRSVLIDQTLVKNAKIEKPIFAIFNELLSTQNVNVARFARNVECDILSDFQTLCVSICSCQQKGHFHSCGSPVCVCVSL